jgi:hypothetical protein
MYFAGATERATLKTRAAGRLGQSSDGGVMEPVLHMRAEVASGKQKSDLIFISGATIGDKAALWAAIDAAIAGLVSPADLEPLLPPDPGPATDESVAGGPV